MNFTCPKCQHEAQLEMLAGFDPKSTVTLHIHPLPDQLLSPLVVGGMMRSLERLLVASNDAVGLKASVVISKMQSHVDGSVEVAVNILRHAKEAA